MRFAITATYSHHTEDGYVGARQIPTFYLDGNVQGIATEAEAETVAREILTAAVREMPVNDTLSITAVEV